MFRLCVVLYPSLLLLLPSIQASDLDPYMTTNVNQQQEIVDKHNSLRRSVQPPASNMLRMAWSPGAASNAQSWANKCLLKSSTPESRIVDGMNCGENIFMSSIILTWSQVIQKWHDQGKNFVYGSGGTSGNTGVYTQLVWYSSRLLGCAVAHCPAQAVYDYFYVCQYCPAGNRVDQIKTPYKKGEPCGDCPNACDRGLCTNPCTEKDEWTNCPDMKKLYGCDIPLMKKCGAACKCTTEIK